MYTENDETPRAIHCAPTAPIPTRLLTALPYYTDAATPTIIHLRGAHLDLVAQSLKLAPRRVFQLQLRRVLERSAPRCVRLRARRAGLPPLFFSTDAGDAISIAREGVDPLLPVGDHAARRHDPTDLDLRMGG